MNYDKLMLHDALKRKIRTIAGFGNTDWEEVKVILTSVIKEIDIQVEKHGSIQKAFTDENETYSFYYSKRRR